MTWCASIVFFLCPVLDVLLAGQTGALGSSAVTGSSVRIELCRDGQGTSRGSLFDADGATVFSFPVGYGRKGWLEAGSRFRDGFSLLGKFRINAILAPGRCEMTPQLLQRSGKDEEYLRERLFLNMDSIDFDADGRGGEYGGGYLSLEPMVGQRNGKTRQVVQPFAFCEFKGVFRWYSFAIHGTQDASRVGRASTGGCINVGEQTLESLLAILQLGDTVEIVSRSEPGAGQSRDRSKDVENETH